MLRLGSDLVARGLVTQAQVEEAVRAQVVFGGRLGTTLVELGYLSERALAQILGERARAPFIDPATPIEPTREAKRTLPERLAKRHLLVPLTLEGRRLFVAMASVSDVAALSEAEFATGCAIVPVIATELTLYRLLERHYGVAAPMRYVTLDASALAPNEAPPGAPQEALVVPSLFDAAPADLSAEDVAATPPADETDLVEETILELTDEVPAEPEVVPLTLEQAMAAIATAPDRQALGRIVLGVAKRAFPRSILLTVQRGHVFGWDALGPIDVRLRVRSLALPLTRGGIFSRVVSMGSHYLGPIEEEPGNVELFAQLGWTSPKTALALPVFARQKVVYIVYGDKGPNRPAGADISDLVIVAQQIPARIEALVKARQQTP